MKYFWCNTDIKEQAVKLDMTQFHLTDFLPRAHVGVADPRSPTGIQKNRTGGPKAAQTPDDSLRPHQFHSRISFWRYEGEFPHPTTGSVQFKDHVRLPAVHIDFHPVVYNAKQSGRVIFLNNRHPRPAAMPIANTGASTFSFRITIHKLIVETFCVLRLSYLG